MDGDIRSGHTLRAAYYVTRKFSPVVTNINMITNMNLTPITVHPAIVCVSRDLCIMYRSGTVNSNTVNSKFHLIRSYCEIFTSRNEVLAKVIFLHLSVIHSVHRGEYLTRHPPGRHLPGQTPPSRQTPPSSRQTPPSSRQTPPPGRHPPGIRSTLGRYASYWKAFLFSIISLTFHA